jgi:formylglycine-generating enzyme required for sulfatase activity
MSAPPPAAIQVPLEPWRILRWRSRHQAYREVLAPGVVITMLRIPAGSFLMGAPEGEEGSGAAERPVHQVKLEEFLMAQTPITQAQWRVVAGWQAREGERWEQDLDPDPSDFKGDQRPVENVSWNDAAEFCRRLRQRTGKSYTLPSEAQWEYACRAGTATPFHFGATITTELANYSGGYTYADGPTGDYREQTTDVATFPANPWDLHDMHGNVWEWCADHWHGNYEGAPEDGRPWLYEKSDKDGARLLRGGSWLSIPRYCRSAYRNGLHPGIRDFHFGFRVCCLPQDSASLPLNP